MLIAKVQQVTDIKLYMFSNPLIYITIFWHCSGRQPVIQELRSVLSEAREDWKLESQKLEDKFDEIIKLQREKLDLEREKLEFEREKLGLTKKKSGPAGTMLNLSRYYGT